MTDTSTPAPAAPEPRTFVIAQQQKEDKAFPIRLRWRDLGGQDHDVDFVTHPKRIPQITALRVTTIGSTGDMSPVFRVFETAMDKEEFDRFFGFCENEDHLVQAEALVDIMRVLIEESTGFPTEQP